MVEIKASESLIKSIDVQESLIQDDLKREPTINIISIAILMILVPIILIVLYRILGTHESLRVFYIPSVFAVVIVILFFRKEISSSLIDKYDLPVCFYTQLELMELLPNLELLCLYGNKLRYTLKTDKNKVVKEIELIGFSFVESTAVKNITIDLDDFLVLTPYKQ
jgi:hypothetical protein